MIVKEIEITSLKEYKNNPRINDAAVEKVAASINEFGFKVPIVIDKNNVIVCGHTRVKAAQSLGLDVVPCIVADDLTDEQIKAFRLADNKTAELAAWDFEKLETELANIEIDMSVFGFDTEETMFDETDLDKNDEKTGGVQLTITFETYNDYDLIAAELKNIVETNNGRMAVRTI